MGGGGSSTNQQMVQMQQQQSQQAQQANQQTQARMQYGVNQINDIFNGTPAGASVLDLSSIANAPAFTGTLPTTSTPYNPAVTVPGQVQSTGYLSPAEMNSIYGSIEQSPLSKNIVPGTYGGQLGSGYSWGVLGDTGGGTSYGIFDPQGNLVTDASSPAALAASKIYVGGDPNNTVGGIQPSFYDNFRSGVLNYYLPQVDQQYQNAKSSLGYALARAGQLNSGVAGMDVANLAQQNQINNAQIASQADTQTATLRNQVAQNQQSALNQLYATENPSVAANSALNSVANANMTTPVLSPVGQLFSNVAVGMGNAVAGYTNSTAGYLPSSNTGGAMGNVYTAGSGATSSGMSGGSGVGGTA